MCVACWPTLTPLASTHAILLRNSAAVKCPFQRRRCSAPNVPACLSFTPTPALRQCRYLENPPPPACTLYDKAISITSMSKCYGIPGCRIGWLACKDQHVSLCVSALVTIFALGFAACILYRLLILFVPSARSCLTRSSPSAVCLHHEQLCRRGACDRGAEAWRGDDGRTPRLHCIKQEDRD